MLNITLSFGLGALLGTLTTKILEIWREKQEERRRTSLLRSAILGELRVMEGELERIMNVDLKISDEIKDSFQVYETLDENRDKLYLLTNHERKSLEMLYKQLEQFKAQRDDIGFNIDEMDQEIKDDVFKQIRDQLKQFGIQLDDDAKDEAIEEFKDQVENLDKELKKNVVKNLLNQCRACIRKINSVESKS